MYSGVLALVLLLVQVSLIDSSNESRIVNGFDLNDYHSYEQVGKYLKSIQSDRLSYNNIGFSSEHHPIYVVKIDRNSTKSILIDAGTHAREWISIATALQLITNLSRTNDWPAVNVYIVPIVNPDGYEYTRVKDRMWRNSRSGRHKCGADLNRNYANNWGVSGTSDQICSEIYHGRGPFSEPESRSIANLMKLYKNELKGYVSLHAFDNSILVPYGYSVEALPHNFGELFDVANSMTSSMNSVYGNNYKVIKSSSLYPASGCSDDYAKSIGIRYTYTIELTTGFYKDKYVGFETPREMIGQTADEVRVGIVQLLHAINERP